MYIVRHNNVNSPNSLDLKIVKLKTTNDKLLQLGKKQVKYINIMYIK